MRDQHRRKVPNLARGGTVESRAQSNRRGGGPPLLGRSKRALKSAIPPAIQAPSSLPRSPCRRQRLLTVAPASRNGSDGEPERFLPVGPQFPGNRRVRGMNSTITVCGRWLPSTWRVLLAALRFHRTRRRRSPRFHHAISTQSPSIHRRRREISCHDEWRVPPRQRLNPGRRWRGRARVLADGRRVPPRGSIVEPQSRCHRHVCVGTTGSAHRRQRLASAPPPVRPQWQTHIAQCRAS